MKTIQVTDEMFEFLEKTKERLKTQDNRMTENPMFCVQRKVRDTGYDSAYSDNKCWWNAGQLECVYTEPEDLEGWEEFGYRDRWETVMVAFTEYACQQHLALNGHNYHGETRIYVESFNRCPEMMRVRELLINWIDLLSNHNDE